MAKIKADGSYTANEDLYVGVAFARRKGEVVSGEEVQLYGWDDKVSAYDKDTDAPADKATQAKDSK